MILPIHHDLASHRSRPVTRAIGRDGRGQGIGEWQRSWPPVPPLRALIEIIKNNIMSKNKPQINAD